MRNKNTYFPGACGVKWNIHSRTVHRVSSRGDCFPLERRVSGAYRTPSPAFRLCSPRFPAALIRTSWCWRGPGRAQALSRFWRFAARQAPRITGCPTPGHRSGGHFLLQRIVPARDWAWVSRGSCLGRCVLYHWAACEAGDQHVPPRTRSVGSPLKTHPFGRKLMLS